MKRLFLSLALSLSLTLTPALAAGTLTVDGQAVEAAATVRGSTTYVSLRSVTQALQPDALILWTDGRALAEGAGFSLTARPGACYLEVNGRALYIPQGVLLEKGVTLVPVRVLAEALGAGVEWDRATGAVHVTSGEGGIPGEADVYDPADLHWLSRIISAESRGEPLTGKLAVGNVILVTSGEGGIPGEADVYDPADLHWLSRIISAESRGEPLTGKLAVGNVILNRVDHGEFPDTIYGVIFDSRWGGQFEPVRNGTIYGAPTAESVIAAKLVLEGADAAGDSLYFLAPSLTDNHWIMANRDYVATIGAHWFYR